MTPYVTFGVATSSHPCRREHESMKRTLGLSLVVLAAVAVFAGLVHAVLVASGVSEPAATTVYGLTSRRLWATSAGALALVGVVAGGLALVRSVRRIGHGGRRGAIVALRSCCLPSRPQRSRAISMP